MKRTRPSSMPRAFECPSSIEPAVAPVNTRSDESDLGSAAHKALAQFVAGGEPDVVEIAREYGVDADDLAPLVAFGRKAWASYGRYFPGVRVEARLDSDLGDGTADLLSRVLREGADQDEAIVLGDWKSGRNRREHRRQVQAYAEAARQSFGMPASGRITAVVFWLRYGEVEVLQFTAADLDAFRAEYLELERHIGRRFNPGEHCTGCQREFECPARDAFLRSSATALVAANSDALAPEKLGELYPQAQMLEKALETYKTAVRLAVAARGHLDIGNGKRLELVEAKRAVIDPHVARPVLAAAGFSEDDIARVSSMSKGEIETVVGERAPRGLKKQHQVAIVRALEEAGALTLQSFTRLQQTKIGG